MANLDRATRKLRRWLSSLEEVALDESPLALRQAVDELEAKAVELAPVKSGNLQSSTVTRFFKKGDDAIGELAFTAPYAADVHELPENARGPQTQAKPGNEFGLAGPKYLERPLRGMQEELGGITGDAIVKAWRRGARIR